MRILEVNKFLHPKGGAEAYMLSLGRHLSDMGHEVMYFGMDSPDRTVGNRAGAYGPGLDFHAEGRLRKLTYPIRVIYSRQARKKIRQVLEDFQPDVCHLNNFNYQLTPSILLEIRKWERQSGHRCRILYTAHDYQLICPNHRCHTGRECCERCLTGNFRSCIANRCIHGSRLRSLLGALEAIFWKKMEIYRQIDRIICCSGFMKKKLDADPILAQKTAVLHNFVEDGTGESLPKQDYVLYFGRYAPEKGMQTLLQAARALPGIPFVFAGAGPMEAWLEDIPNVRNLGFLSGPELERLVRQARFTVYPSEWYENCPLSVMESIRWGTPVLGADIGGIPELIRPGETGALFESGDPAALTEGIRMLWEDRQLLDAMTQNCRAASFDTPREYIRKLLQLIPD